MDIAQVLTDIDYTAEGSGSCFTDPQTYNGWVNNQHSTSSGIGRVLGLRMREGFIVGEGLEDNTSEREEIERLTQEFLATGKAISHIPYGVSGIEEEDA